MFSAFGMTTSTDLRHYYRFTYLKSEHWEDLRLRKLVAVDAKCCLCDLRDLSNDVHHVVYRKLYDVRLSDLRVLCRNCHSKAHTVLDKFPDIKDPILAKLRWTRTAKRIRLLDRQRMLDAGQTKQQKDKKVRDKFKIARFELRMRGVIFFKEQMAWSKKLLKWYRARSDEPTNVEWLHAAEMFDHGMLWPCGDH